MGKYVGDIAEDATVTHWWETVDSSGASVTRATDGTIKVIRDDGTDCTGTSVTDSEDSVDTGIHKVAVDTSDSANFATGHDYAVWVDGAVIDGQTVNALLFTFSIENRGVILADGVTHGGSSAAFTFGLGGSILNSAGAGLQIGSTGGNGIGLAIAGNGSGHGIQTAGGATGNGILTAGGATSGIGLFCYAQNDGQGIYALASGDNHGAIFAGSGSGDGMQIIADTTGAGLAVHGGSVSGHGFHANAQNSGHGIYGTAAGNGSGITVTGAGTGDGILATSAGTGYDINADIQLATGDLGTILDDLDTEVDAINVLVAEIGDALSTPVSAESSTVTQGTETNTFAATATHDGTEYIVTDSGAGIGIDFYLEFDVGDELSTPIVFHFHGYYDEGGGPFTNSIAIQAYNWVTASWDTIGTLTNASAEEEHVLSLGAVYGGQPAADPGIVRIRFLQNAQEASSAVHIDHCYVGYTQAIASYIGTSSDDGDDTVFGWLKAMANKASSTPSGIGGTFDPSTDSLEGIVDGGVAGSGTTTRSVSHGTDEVTTGAD